MTLDQPRLQTRKPTGQVPAPFILLEGEEKAGKTWAAVQLTVSERVGACYFLDLGEGTADEYGAIPGAAFDVLVHDGTYASVLEQVLAVKAAAKAASEAGHKPVVLIIDSLSDEWDGLRNWANERAKKKPSNQQKLAADPAAELDVSRNIWNDVDRRHGKLMTALLTFPGIVVGTARGKSISATDPSTGQPFKDGRRDYRVEGHKQLAYQATMWVRMVRNGDPLVIGARSVHAGIKPGEDKPQPVIGHPDDLLEFLVFTALRYDPDVKAVRDLRNMTGGELTDDERANDPDQQPPAPPQRRELPTDTPAEVHRERAKQHAAEKYPPRTGEPSTVAGAPATPGERLAMLHAQRDARAIARAGKNLPPLETAKARAWDACAMLHHDWTQDQRADELVQLCIDAGETTLTAPAELWHAIADKLEATLDELITRETVTP